jgi:hypothetical protein
MTWFPNEVLLEKSIAFHDPIRELGWTTAGLGRHAFDTRHDVERELSLEADEPLGPQAMTHVPAYLENRPRMLSADGCREAPAQLFGFIAVSDVLEGRGDQLSQDAIHPAKVEVLTQAGIHREVCQRQVTHGGTRCHTVAGG